MDLQVVSAVSGRQKLSRYPPVTPNANLKDGVVHSVFDSVWSMLTDSMRILLQRYSEYFVLTHPIPIASPEEINDNDNNQIKLPQISKLGGTRIDLASTGPRIGSVLARLSHTNQSKELMDILHIRQMGMTDRREKTYL